MTEGTGTREPDRSPPGQSTAEAALRLWGAAGVTEEFDLSGHSMRPIFDGAQRVRVRLGMRPRFGDIALFSRNDNLIVHRLVGRVAGGHRTRGDGQQWFDPQPMRPEELHGVVTHLLKGGRAIDLDGPGAGGLRWILGAASLAAGAIRLNPAGPRSSSRRVARLRDTILALPYRLLLLGSFRAYTWTSPRLRRLANLGHRPTARWLLDALRGTPDAPPGPATAGPDRIRRAASVAVSLGVGPLLLQRCRERDRLPVLPADVRTLLQRTHDAQLVYNTGILSTLEALVEELQARDVRPILLKGAALAGPLYGAPALRFLADLDLLVREREVSVVDDVLRRKGFRPLAHEQRDGAAHHHLPGYVPPEGYPRIEIHTGLIHPRYGFRLDLEAMRGRCANEHLGHIPVAVLGPVDQMLHTCLHLAVSDGFVRGVKDLIDIDLMARRSPMLDWKDLALTAERQGIARVVHYPLELARRLLGTPVGADACRRLRRHRLPYPEDRLLGHLAAIYVTSVPGEEALLGVDTARRIARLWLTEPGRLRRLSGTVRLLVRRRTSGPPV